MKPTIAISGPGDDQSPAVTGGSVSPGCSDSAATVDAGTTTMLRLDEAEEDDEQADADADGPAQIDRDGARHGFAQPEQDAAPGRSRRRAR